MGHCHPSVMRKLRLKEGNGLAQTTQLINAIAGTKTQFSPDPSARSRSGITMPPRFITDEDLEVKRREIEQTASLYPSHTEGLLIAGPKLH